MTASIPQAWENIIRIYMCEKINVHMMFLKQVQYDAICATEKLKIQHISLLLSKTKSTECERIKNFRQGRLVFSKGMFLQ